MTSDDDRAAIAREAARGARTDRIRLLPDLPELVLACDPAMPDGVLEFRDPTTGELLLRVEGVRP